MNRFLLVLVALTALAGQVSGALQFDFDYRYDSFGFFDEPARREAMEAAGRLVNRYVDDLEAIIPEGSNGWDSYFSPPDDGDEFILSDLPVAEGTMQIFVAGAPVTGILAQAIDTAPLGRGDSDWVDTVAYRGQAGAAATPATDFGPMGGTISFNNNPEEVPWHFGLSTDGLESNEFDFVTVAMHEIIHLLGFGICRSFDGQVNGLGRFVGAESVAVGSVTNPNLQLDLHEAHWLSGTKSPWNGQTQEALLAPGIYPGRRAFPTVLDRAALRDVGWEEASPGDANRDRAYNSSDMVTVFVAGLYETGNLASWSEGDWDDNALFDSADLVVALQTGTYEQEPLAAVNAVLESGGEPSLSVLYDPDSGRLRLHTDGRRLTSLQITSQRQLLLAEDHLLLDGVFDVARADKIFKLQLDGFTQLDLGSILPANLELPGLAADLAFDGSWWGGGAVEDVQLRLVPEPSSVLACLMAAGALWLARRRR